MHEPQGDECLQDCNLLQWEDLSWCVRARVRARKRDFVGFVRKFENFKYSIIMQLCITNYAYLKTCLACQKTLSIN